MNKQPLFWVAPSMPLALNLAASRAELYLDRYFSLYFMGYAAKKLTYTEKTHMEVVNQIEAQVLLRRSYGPPIYIEGIIPKNPWSSMNATTFEDKPGKIFFNMRKKIDSVKAFLTILHEVAHIAGFNHGTDRFKNFRQSSEPKLSSVPVQMAKVGEIWVRKL